MIIFCRKNTQKSIEVCTLLAKNISELAKIVFFRPKE